MVTDVAGSAHDCAEGQLFGVSGSAHPGDSCVSWEDSEVDTPCLAIKGLVEGLSGDEATGTGTFLVEARVTDLRSFHAPMVICLLFRRTGLCLNLLGP